MASEWFCRVMGEVWGPMSTMELIAIARRGRLSRDDQVRRSDQETWVRAELVRGLMNVAPVSKTATSDRLVAAIHRALPARRSVRRSEPSLFWVKAGHTTSGPFDSRTLRRLAERGSLKPSHLVSKDREHWVRASRVKGLSFGPVKSFEATMSAHSAVVLEYPVAANMSPEPVIIATQPVRGALAEALG